MTVAVVPGKEAVSRRSDDDSVDLIIVADLAADAPPRRIIEQIGAGALQVQRLIAEIGCDEETAPFDWPQIPAKIGMDRDLQRPRVLARRPPELRLRRLEERVSWLPLGRPTAPGNRDHGSLTPHLHTFFGVLFGCGQLVFSGSASGTSRTLREAGTTVPEIIRRTGLSKASVYRALAVSAH